MRPKLNHKSPPMLHCSRQFLNRHFLSHSLCSRPYEPETSVNVCGLKKETSHLVYHSMIIVEVLHQSVWCLMVFHLQWHKFKASIRFYDVKNCGIPRCTKNILWKNPFQSLILNLKGSSPTTFCHRIPPPTFRSCTRSSGGGGGGGVHLLHPPSHHCACLLWNANLFLPLSVCMCCQKQEMVDKQIIWSQHSDILVQNFNY